MNSPQFAFRSAKRDRPSIGVQSYLISGTIVPQLRDDRTRYQVRSLVVDKTLIHKLQNNPDKHKVIRM